MSFIENWLIVILVLQKCKNISEVHSSPNFITYKSQYNAFSVKHFKKIIRTFAYFHLFSLNFLIKRCFMRLPSLNIFSHISTYNNSVYFLGIYLNSLIIAVWFICKFKFKKLSFENVKSSSGCLHIVANQSLNKHHSTALFSLVIQYFRKLKWKFWNV